MKTLTLRARRFCVSNNGTLLAAAKDEHCQRVTVGTVDVERFGVVRQYGRSGCFLVGRLCPDADPRLTPDAGLVFFVLSENQGEALALLKAARSRLPKLRHMPQGRTNAWAWEGE